MNRIAGLLALAVVLSIPSTSFAPPPPVTALAPFDILFEGAIDLVGVAVATDGTVFVSDRSAGVVYRRAPAGAVTTIASGLQRPAGLALDAAGGLLIAEEQAGRVLRYEAAGGLSVVTSGIRAPRWLAPGAAGQLYVSAHGLSAEDGPDPDEGRQIVLYTPGGGLAVVAFGIRRLEGLALLDGALVAASQGLESGSDSAGVLLRYPLAAGGQLGAAQPWMATGLKQPVGLVLDVLNAVFVSTKELTALADAAKRAVGKLHVDLRLTGFADGFDDPQGLALGPDGSLYVADGRGGRLLRFRAPPEPSLNVVPAAVNIGSVILSGIVEPGARVDVALQDVGLVAAAAADGTGAFSLPVALAENAVNELLVSSTSHGGDGLTGPPAVAEIAHDGVAPSVRFLEPAANTFVRQTVTVRARVEDHGTGAASVTLSLDGEPLGSRINPDPAQPFTAALGVDTRAHADGTHSLAAAAQDRAGNGASAVRTIIVDNTPPDTEITGGPGGPTSAATAVFTFAGSDSMTPSASLVFSWRLDDGAWSAFAAETTASFSGLAVGLHAFEVRAQDLAGNEDATPAVRSFTVGSSVSVTITEPLEGAMVAVGTIVVRGTLQDAAGEVGVGVTINGLPAAVHGGQFAAAVPVSMETSSVAAVATTGTGATASHTISITVLASGDSLLTLHTTPSTGVAPLTVAFSATAGVSGIFELDADGDGQVDFTGPAVDGQAFTFLQPGLFVPTLTVIDAQGNRLISRAVIHVVDRASFDALFQARWGDIRAALGRGDVDAAVAVIARGEQERYRRAFVDLVPDLPAVAASLRDIVAIDLGDGIAEYATTQDRHDGTYVHFIYFMRDDDGLWKIVAM